jgi:hypothetical protein
MHQRYSIALLFGCLLTLAATGKDAPEAGSGERPPAVAGKQPGKDESAPDAKAPDAKAPDAKAPDAQAPTARPVAGEPVQVYGWREWVTIDKSKERLKAKLDTGALTSSLHAENVELFERDGAKWVRFILTDPGNGKSKSSRISAPLVRTARIKSPGGESETRFVVRLEFTIGDRRQRAEFTLNDRNNMISPVLIGRSALTELGLIDPGRTYLADEKIFR